MRSFWARLASLIALATIASGAHAQAVLQSGPVVPFHAPAWFGNGIVADGGNSTTPFINSLALFNGSNCPLSVSSQTGAGASTSPHSQLSICQTDTATTFNIQGVNGQPAPSLQFNIGGTTYPFPSAVEGLTTTMISSSITAQVGQSYGVKTSLGAYTVTLPSVASLSDGATIWVTDIDDNAQSNNITIAGSGSDKINFFNSQLTSLVLNHVSAGASFVLRGGAWRANVLAGPQFGLDATGACRNLSVWDIASAASVNIGCIGSTGFVPNGVFTLIAALPDEANGDAVPTHGLYLSAGVLKVNP